MFVSMLHLSCSVQCHSHQSRDQLDKAVYAVFRFAHTQSVKMFNY